MASPTVRYNAKRSWAGTKQCAAGSACHRGVLGEQRTKCRRSSRGAAGHAAGGSADTEHNLVEADFSVARIDRATDTGFVINNVHVRGPVIAYGGLWLMWRVDKLSDVTPESLSLLHVLKPVPDLLVFGSGADRDRPPAATLAMLRELNVGVESLPTESAIQHYNLLSQERRNVACALLLDTMSE